MPKPNPNLLAANAAAGYPQPILYLPLSDPTQPGKNLGTGGDFALNGVVARSGRGPSQFNAPYSDLDGSADYLSISGRLSGATNGKQCTLSFVYNSDNTADNKTILYIGNPSGADRFWVMVKPNGTFSVTGWNTSGVMILEASFNNALVTNNRNNVVSISFDLSNAAKRFIFVNGVQVTTSWGYYSDEDIGFAGPASNPNCLVGASASGLNLFNGRLGNVFFDTRYIDLSQPANLAKFVTGTGIDAKPADLGANGEKPFGTPPLIYLPMYGNNAGKNYGTGGDFTVNSGPFAGARGPNEFWGNKAAFNGSTGRFNRAAQLSGIADSKTLTFAFSVNKADSVLYTLSDTTGATLRATINASNQLILLGKNSSGVTILSATVTTTISNATDTSVLVCVDLANPSNRAVYLNNVAASVTWTTYTNDSVDLTVADFSLGSEATGANYLNGSLSEFYFTTDYIDFSQEANRLKFRDAFGNPVDLAPQIVAGTLPNPAIYMRFDPANFGKNSGTGGDFTVSGTITDGGQL